MHIIGGLFSLFNSEIFIAEGETNHSGASVHEKTMVKYVVPVQKTNTNVQTHLIVCHIGKIFQVGVQGDKYHSIV